MYCIFSKQTALRSNRAISLLPGIYVWQEIRGLEFKFLYLASFGFFCSLPKILEKVYIKTRIQQRGISQGHEKLISLSQVPFECGGTQET
jgi:hypothetical protein